MERGSELLDYEREARQSLDEVRFALSEGWVSETLESTRECAYLNLTTREHRQFCVRLSGRGFQVNCPVFPTRTADGLSECVQVVGFRHDEVSGEEGEAWETVYSLLSHVSPSYILAFSQRLAEQLSRLLLPLQLSSHCGCVCLYRLQSEDAEEKESG